jgi:hypothetical protein
MGAQAVHRVFVQIQYWSNAARFEVLHSGFPPLPQLPAVLVLNVSTFGVIGFRRKVPE